MNIATLVQGFATHIRDLKAPDYKESQVRLHYLDPFWTLLGWDVKNEAQRAPQDVEVVVEPSMDSVEDDGLRAREPDYLFRVNGFSRFIVEAKKPAVDIDTDKKPFFKPSAMLGAPLFRSPSSPILSSFAFMTRRLNQSSMNPTAV
jgi:hypothetical protein